MSIRTVLIDDSADTLEVLSLHFGMLYPTLDVIATGQTIEEAIEICTSEPVDLISIDIHLRDESGLHLCQEIHQKYPHMFITICSMESGLDYRSQAMEAGAHFFLSKPFGIHDVHDLLHAYKTFRRPKLDSDTPEWFERLKQEISFLK